jgi:hypothetical protein
LDKGKINDRSKSNQRSNYHTCDGGWGRNINSLIIANIDGSNAADITVEVSIDNGSNYVAIAKTISVPADATLVVVGKDNGFYLDETDLLAVTASAASDLTYLVSYELMTD